MDDTFTPANVGNPPEGQTIELWHCGECVRGYKRDGAWYAEDGTRIMVDGWRLIEKGKDAEGEKPIDDDSIWNLPPKPTVKPKPKPVVKLKWKHK